MDREEQRERLIKLLKKAPFLNVLESEWELAAEWLLSNGVIVPPCEIGDTLWYISRENPHVAFEKELKARKTSEAVAGILITKDDVYISSYNIEDVISLCDKVNTDYAYLSKEEAEKAMKEEESENIPADTQFEYKGYVLQQSGYNNHYMIFKDNKMIMHCQCTEKLDQKGAEEAIDFYIKLSSENDEEAEGDKE